MLDGEILWGVGWTAGDWHVDFLGEGHLGGEVEAELPGVEIDIELEVEGVDCAALGRLLPHDSS
jgi:hypothetical protein